MKRSEIYDPRYCKKCGGRLAIPSGCGSGSIRTTDANPWESDCTFHCTCRHPYKQADIRREQEKTFKASKHTKRRLK